MASKSRIELQNWLAKIDVKGSTLDVGGSQNPIVKRVKSWDVQDYKIMDLEQPHECKQQPDLCADIQSYPAIYDLYKRDYIFDNIFCIEVAEYWTNPQMALENMARLLSDDGMLYISFHFMYGLHNPKGEDCLRYTKYGIIKLMENIGLEIIEIIPRTLSEEGRFYLEKFYRAEGMRLDYSYPETWAEGHLVKARKK